MRSIFENDSTEAALMVDASNAFNSFNREAALRNTHILCPSLAPKLTNMYRSHSTLFIGGSHTLSQEGTTQGDPLAIGILPLIDKVSGVGAQSWYTDNVSAGGTVPDLRRWWDKLQSIGPLFGYHPNPRKTWLVVKPKHHQAIEECFQGTGVNITTDGLTHLGAALGSHSFMEAFIHDKVSVWVREVDRLTELAECYPQAAYTVLT